MPRHARLIVARPLPTLPSTADPHGSANHTDRPPHRQFRNASVGRRGPPGPVQTDSDLQMAGVFPARATDSGAKLSSTWPVPPRVTSSAVPTLEPNRAPPDLPATVPVDLKPLTRPRSPASASRPSVPRSSAGRS
jgi:hypothetical protein